MQEAFLKNFTDFIFLEDQPQKADVIFVPGNGWPQMARRAAELWKEGTAPWILPSGRYSITKGKFSGVRTMEERYPGPYETEWKFLRDVLIKEGVPGEAILKEDQASYTYENAIFSRQVTDAAGIQVRRGIICCQSHHARRCRMYYQLLYPDTEFLVVPSNTEVAKENWYRSEHGIDLVLGEVERCGGQFHQILRELKEKKEQSECCQS
ncbi:MAG: YdcF family protein [Lacrimispora saccharolytica]